MEEGVGAVVEEVVAEVKEQAFPNPDASYLVKSMSGPAWEGKDCMCSRDVRP